MVEIIHSSRLERAWPLANPNMRRLVYTALTELPRLLKEKAYHFSRHSNTVQRPTVVESITQDCDSTREDIQPKSDEPGMEEEHDAIQRKDIASVSFSDKPGKNRPDTLSEEQLTRIRWLQRLYRRVHKRPSEWRMEERSLRA